MSLDFTGVEPGTGTKINDEDIAKRVEEHNKKAQVDTNKIIKITFPQKILQLNGLIEKEFKTIDLSLAAVDMTDQIPIPAAPADMVDQCKNNQNECSEHSPFLFPKGAIDVNKKNLDLIEKLKPLLLDMIEDTVTMVLGVNLLVPMIEDGNNTGVEVQELTIDMITDVQTRTKERFDEFSAYYEVRGNWIKKAIKNPHCMDFRAGLTLYDESWHFRLIMMYVRLRSDYSLLHDFCFKNLAKITKPRGTTSFDHMF